MNQTFPETQTGGSDDVFFQFLNCIVVEIDPKGNIVRVNPFAEKCLGWNTEDMHGKPFVGGLALEKSTSGKDQAAVFDDLLRHSGGSGSVEVEVRTSDGGTMEITWAVNIYFEPGGSKEKIVCMGVDRQASMKREEDIQRKYDLMESFFDASKACVFAMNSKKRFFYVSPGIFDVNGYLPEEIVGRKPDTFFDKEEKQTINGMIEAAIGKAATDIHLKKKIRHKDGTHVWCEMDKTLYYRENMDFEGIVGVKRNIEAQKKTETELADREKEFRFCLDHAQVMLTVTDEDGVIRSINRVGARMYGREPEEMIGRGFTEFLPDFEKERVFHVFKKDFKTAMSKVDGRTVGMGGLINKIKTPDGLKDILFYKTGIKVFKNGKLEGILNTAVDITETVKAREELKRHRNQLEQLVAERTVELHGLQEEMLQRDRLTALGKMANVISEEIRTPLSTISTSFFVINERLKGKNIGVKRSLERADRAIQRCYSIVDEFKTFTILDDLKKETTDVDTWLNKILDQMAEEKGVVAKRELGAGVSIDIDREQIQRAVMNVLENAWQAERHGTITVKSKMAFNRLEVEIDDSGVGISRQDLERVFEPLFSTKSFGLGLGLPICRQIMEQHGGGISIESEEKRGTTVLLWLPVDDIPSN